MPCGGAGVYDEALEVTFDQEFAGGTNLGGKLRSRCGRLQRSVVQRSVVAP